MHREHITYLGIQMIVSLNGWQTWSFETENKCRIWE